MSVAKPTLFIASTNEGRTIAKEFERELTDSCHVTSWTRAFEAGSYTLEALEEAASSADFAIVIFTGEDWTRSKGKLQRAPRDNLLFEAGLFVGKLGRRRTFIVVDSAAALKIPSDLSGITMPQIDLQSASGLRESIRPVCTRIEEIIARRGGRHNDVDGKVRPCFVDIFYHERGFTRAHAASIHNALAERKVYSVIHEHSDSLTPDAIFIGSMVTAAEARLVLPLIPYTARYLFRPDYPDSEGGDSEGRKIGIGYASKYNAGLRGERGVPSKISSAEFNQLCNGAMTNAQLAMFLAQIHARAQTASKVDRLETAAAGNKATEHLRPVKTREKSSRPRPQANGGTALRRR